MLTSLETNRQTYHENSVVHATTSLAGSLIVALVQSMAISFRACYFTAAALNVVIIIVASSAAEGNRVSIYTCRLCTHA